MTRAFDAIVIGANVGGLAAAALLAGRGARVLLAEQALAPPAPFGALFALDPELVTRLRLARQGLIFAWRDLSLTSWSEDGELFVLRRDRRATAASLARAGEGEPGWDGFTTRLNAMARGLRRWWWNPMTMGRPEDVLFTRGARARFERLCVTGAENWLDASLQSPRLAATLLFDAGLGGLAPSEPGSALALVWRAAQEMAGLQGAAAIAAPGALVAALRSAARDAGVETRLGTQVAAISSENGAATGVVLGDGERVVARVMLSSLPRAASEGLAGLDVPSPEPGGVGEARLLFTLADGVLPASLESGRFILAETPALYADAHEAARAGRIAADVPLECVMVAPNQLAVIARPVPLAPEGGWSGQQSVLAARIAKRLSRHIPGFAGALVGLEMQPPRPALRATLARLVAPAAQRATTRLAGLYLCGEDAEPLPCVSGRGGRFAAHFAAAQLGKR